MKQRPAKSAKTGSPVSTVKAQEMAKRGSLSASGKRGLADINGCG
ncbi:hypothetical protein ACNKHM_08395 [Shigella sonnei]